MRGLDHRDNDNLEHEDCCSTKWEWFSVIAGSHALVRAKPNLGTDPWSGVSRAVGLDLA
jgi:hypothetical protein